MTHSFCLNQLAAILFTALLSACVATPVPQAEIKPVLEIPAGTNARPIQFQKIMAKIPLGEKIGTIQYGWGCFPGSSIGWRGGRLNITDEELTDTFRRELESRNYPVVGDPYALFDDPSASKAEILVAGLITKVEVNTCFPFSGSPTLDIGNRSAVKGGAFMRVAWQAYDVRERKVVYEVATEGSFQSDEVISGGFPIVLRNAFAASVSNLLADAGFHRLVMRAKTQASGRDT